MLNERERERDSNSEAMQSGTIRGEKDELADAVTASVWAMSGRPEGTVEGPGRGADSLPLEEPLPVGVSATPTGKPPMTPKGLSARIGVVGECVAPPPAETPVSVWRKSETAVGV